MATKTITTKVVATRVVARKTENPTTSEIAAALVALARELTQTRAHEALCKDARVDVDRAGAALLYKLLVEGENARLTDLAERLGIDSPAVTRKVQQLEREGLLCRSVDPQDARASRLKLTARGRDSIERLLRARDRWLDGLMEGWSQADRKEFARLLHLFTSALSRDEELRHGH
jgi:DNA-binding MarR family transcriptional regulator